MTANIDQNDAILLQSLRQGDQKAFEVIYRRHVKQLFGYVRKNIYNREDCEEIIQEIFESLWIRRQDVEIGSTVGAYLMGVARHKIIRYFRRNDLLKKYRDHFLLFEAVYDEAEDAGANHAAIQATLDKVISELPERCQEALKLRLSEELSNRDIAKRMNISPRTVQVYMFRAFNHIRASYKHHAAEMSVTIPLIASFLL